MADEIDWCPKAAGTMAAYQPEFYDIDKEKWLPVPVTHDSPCGFPWPVGGQIMAHLDLYGYEQAMALAWSYAAQSAASWQLTRKVRVQKYEFVYDIKARKVEVEHG